MAEHDDTPENGELLLDNAVEDDEQEGPEQADDQDSDDEVVFEIDGAPVDAEPSADTGLVKHLRQQLKDREQRLKQLERPQKPIEVGPRPTLASCDYDEERLDAETDAWYARKTEAIQSEQTQKEAEEANRKRFEQEHGAYQAKKAALGFADMAQAEEAVAATLTEWQQNAIIRYAADAAKVTYALGKSSAKRDQIAGITDPIAFAIAVSKLEGAINVTKRPKPPAPEEIARGTGRAATGTDKELERLEKEADRTGDRTALQNYRRGKK